MSNKSQHKDDHVDKALIDMVQRARMIHDSQTIPSTIDGVYWVEAKPVVPITDPTKRAGYWFAVITVQAVDAIWQVVKQATERGKLGYKAKVATKARPGAAPSMREILVCTIDADDTADVERVKHALDALGIDAEWQYAQMDAPR